MPPKTLRPLQTAPCAPPLARHSWFSDTRWFPKGTCPNFHSSQ